MEHRLDSMFCDSVSFHNTTTLQLQWHIVAIARDRVIVKEKHFIKATLLCLFYYYYFIGMNNQHVHLNATWQSVMLSKEMKSRIENERSWEEKRQNRWQSGLAVSYKKSICNVLALQAGQYSHIILFWARDVPKDNFT